MSRYSTIAIPHDMKKELEERAGERPIFRLLAEEFLHEPDMQTLMELKFKAIEQHIGDRLEKLEKAQGTQTDLIMGLGRCIEKLQGYIKSIVGGLSTVGDQLNEERARMLRNEIATNKIVKSLAAGVQIDDADRFNAQVESDALRLESLPDQEVLKLAKQGRDALLNTDVVKNDPELRDYINEKSEGNDEQKR